MRRYRYRLLAGVLVVSAGACSGSLDEAELVARLLEAYHEEYREYRHSLGEPMLVDPSMTLVGEAGVAAASPASEGLIRGAAERAGLAVGDWERAMACGKYTSSRGVPEVIDRGDPPPEGCESGAGTVFAVGVEKSLFSLHLTGSGWSTEWAYSFTATISRVGYGVRVVESQSAWNDW